MDGMVESGANPNIRGGRNYSDGLNSIDIFPRPGLQLFKWMMVIPL